MATTRIVAFAQWVIAFTEWAKQKYDTSSQPIPSTPKITHLGYLMTCKHLEGYTTNGVLPPQQPTTASSAKDTSTTPNKELRSAATTRNTTPLQPSGATAQKNAPKPEAETELPGLEIAESICCLDEVSPDKWYTSLTRIQQLELFVNIKIKTFREHMRVLILPHTRLWDIDQEEDARRRKFFKKYGEAAYWTRYIDSDYTGRVDFLYIDPKEVHWMGEGV